jgi:hypothetical protein
MNKVDKFLADNNQANLHALKVEESMALLAYEAVLENRVDEAQAVDTNKPKLVADFVCAFCACFIFDPVMCDQCDKVFCVKEQIAFYALPGNNSCCLCRQVPTDKIKPLNRKLRRLMKKLRFECLSCKSILVVNEKGMGQGKHEDFCMLAVKYECFCGHNFSGTYFQIKTMLRKHLIKECTHILCYASRKLMRLVNRFLALKVPKTLI